MTRALSGGGALVTTGTGCFACAVLKPQRFYERSRGAMRAASAVVSVALILSQLLLFLHFALIPHRICAIHGLEAAPAAPAKHWVVPRVDRRGSVATPGQSNDGEHERCSLASYLHERLSVARSASIANVEAPVAVRPSSFARVVSLGPSRSLYLLAPKHGPPA